MHFEVTTPRRSLWGEQRGRTGCPVQRTPARNASHRAIGESLSLSADHMAEADGFAPPSSSRGIWARMPDARLEEIPDAGHLLQLDPPDVVAVAMTRRELPLQPSAQRVAAGQMAAS